MVDAKQVAVKAATKSTPEGRIAGTVAKHAAPKVANKLASNDKKLPAKASHRASGQGARDAKQVVAFSAGKTRGTVLKSFDNPMAPALKPKKSVVTYRHMLAAEFWLGFLILLVAKSPTEKDQSEANNLKQLAAFVLVFFFLFLMTASGATGAKFAAALGALILLTILMTETKKKTSGKQSIFDFLPGSNNGVGTGIVSGIGA